jgi:hypothetical protein
MDGQSLTLAIGLVTGASMIAALRRLIWSASWDEARRIRWGNAMIEAGLRWPFPAWRVTIALYASVRIEPAKPDPPRS